LTVFIAACISGAYQLKLDSDRTMTGAFGGGYGKAATVVGSGKTSTLAVGAPVQGKVYLHYGMFEEPPKGASFAGDTFTFTGSPGSEVGWSLASGHFTGDGKADLVIGAPSAKGGKGRVYIVDGANVGVGDIDEDDAAIVITGNAAGDYAGWSVAPGDFNGDGAQDLAVGACGWDSFVGAAYVVYGPLAAEIDLEDHLRIMGEDVPALPGLGCQMLAADLDLDWDDELILSTTFGSGPSSITAGEVHVLYSLPTSDAYVNAVFDRATYESTRSAEGMGHSIAVGDINDDIVPDLIFGAPHYVCDDYVARGEPDPCDNFEDNVGRVYAVLGEAGAHTPGITQLLDIAVEADVIIEGTKPDFGRSLSIGDVDEDGSDDLLIGQPRNSHGFLFYGSPDAGTPGNTNLDTTDANATFTTPDVGGASSVVIADFTGEKAPDCTLITMGQPHHYTPPTHTGLSHVVFAD
jgi:hypothetical protein